MGSLLRSRVQLLGISRTTLPHSAHSYWRSNTRRKSLSIESVLVFWNFLYPHVLR